MTSGVLKYGLADDAAATAARQNFAGAAINVLSLCTTPIELLSNDANETVLGRATGFFWLRNGQPNLVTNYHVVSGRNPLTGELLSAQGYLPKRMNFFGVALDVTEGVVRFSRRKWTVEFGEGTEALFEKPPEAAGFPVDLWAMPIAPGIVFGKDPARKGFGGADTASCFVNEHQGHRIVTGASDDCFILGYPIANYDGLMPPVWKRGSIASDTNLGVGNRPVFLVDAATTPSMSGAPIFRKATTLTANNASVQALQEFSTFEMIGIYAGRLGSADLQATNIGYGWYRTLIDGVLDHYKYGALMARQVPSAPS